MLFQTSPQYVTISFCSDRLSCLLVSMVRTIFSEWKPAGSRCWEKLLRERDRNGRMSNATLFTIDSFDLIRTLTLLLLGSYAAARQLPQVVRWARKGSQTKEEKKSAANWQLNKNEERVIISDNFRFIFHYLLLQLSLCYSHIPKIRTFCTRPVVLFFLFFIPLRAQYFVTFQSTWTYWCFGFS